MDGKAERYTVRNVVLVGVGHDRIMRGETDEVVRRQRDDASEREVMEVLERSGCREPDWFAERWIGGETGLVVAAVWEKPEDAVKFRAAMAVAPLKAVRLVMDPEMARREAKVFSDAWEDSHRKAMGQVEAVVKAAAEDGMLRRIAVGEVWGETKEKAAKAYQEFAQRVAEGRREDDGFTYSAVFEEKELTVHFAFGMPTAADADGVVEMAKAGGLKCEIAEGMAAADALSEVEEQMAAYVAARLKGIAEEARKKAEGAAEAAK